MRARQDALRLVAIGVALTAVPGCGAIFHASQTVTFVTPPKDKAVIYHQGAPLVEGEKGTYSTLVSIAFVDTSGDFVAAAPGKKIKVASPAHHVDAVAIVCDALWTLTIIGVAAPISDALMGTFVEVDERVLVTLEDDPPTENPIAE